MTADPTLCLLPLAFSYISLSSREVRKRSWPWLSSLPYSGVILHRYARVDTPQAFAECEVNTLSKTAYQRTSDDSLLHHRGAPTIYSNTFNSLRTKWQFYLFDELDQALDSTYRAAVAAMIQRQASLVI